MTYTTIFGKTYDDEHDEEMSHKYGETYDYFKKMYPDIKKLPSDEISGIYQVYKQSPAGDTFEKSVDRTKKYIESNLPSWKQTYLPQSQSYATQRQSFKPRSQSFSSQTRPSAYQSQSYAPQTQSFTPQSQQATHNSSPLHTQNDEDDYLAFDGKMLTWNKAGKPYKQWSGMSGNPDYQCAKYQNLPNKGPLPEGDWNVKQSRYQSFDDLSLMDKMVNYGSEFLQKNFNGKPHGKWPGGTESWGRHRIWLEPSDSTNTYGRSNLAIHGGDKLGSNGCIDLTNQLNDFAKEYLEYGKDLPLKVKYPKDCW